MPANPDDIQKIAEGFRGAFYYKGNQWATATQWRVERQVRRSDEAVLDDPMQYSKLQSFSYTLVFEDLTITHSIVTQLLDNDAAANDIEFQFMGEEKRGDGAIAQWIINKCYSDGTLMVAGAQVGQSNKRTYNWRLNQIPSVVNPWD